MVCDIARMGVVKARERDTFCQKELNCMLNWIKVINHTGTFTQ